MYEYFGSGKMAAVTPPRVAEMRCETARAQAAVCETERSKVTHDAPPLMQDYMERWFVIHGKLTINEITDCGLALRVAGHVHTLRGVYYNDVGDSVNGSRIPGW